MSIYSRKYVLMDFKDKHTDGTTFETESQIFKDCIKEACDTPAFIVIHLDSYTRFVTTDEEIHNKRKKRSITEAVAIFTDLEYNEETKELSGLITQVNNFMPYLFEQLDNKQIAIAFNYRPDRDHPDKNKTLISKIWSFDIDNHRYR